ncbi:glycosyltransferase [Acidobacteria bacterium AH-259-D05]|nr:glycosyltransferase [Acidobacteria bacterium AH-259-D05]
MRRRFTAKNDLNGHSVDLVVGVPSYNEVDNIGFVVEQVAEGLKKYYPHLNTAIINADNSSQDGTPDAFLRAESLGIPKVYLATPSGVKGKGYNFHNLFTYLSNYQPKTVVVVDADLRSIRPSWLRSLAQPIIKGYEFVAPIYSRNEYDGTITNHLCYPLIYGLLGKKIRQPIGGEFAFSGRLMEHWRTRTWGKNVRQYGIDIFMTIEALMGEFRVAQVVLGTKVHNPSAPKLGKMFTQVVDTLFSRLLVFKDEWSLSTLESDTPPVYGRTHQLSSPQELGIDYKRLKRLAVQEFASNQDLILRILPSETGKKVQEMFQVHRFRLSSLLWVNIVYSLLGAYARAGDRATRLRVVEALKPLYFARVVSFIRETLELSHAESEKKILHQAAMFRSNRKRVIRSLTWEKSA